jgi:ubiquinone/menaquinone biosynthesis C-methylase UbiE
MLCVWNRPIAIHVSGCPQQVGRRGGSSVGRCVEHGVSRKFFDLVIAMFLLHDMSSEIRPAVMREIIRVTKPEGRVLIIDFHPGPIPFPKGWIYKAVILFIERVAGREHFSNFRDFLLRKGLPGLIQSQNLVVDRQKIVSAGNIAFFLIKPA